MTTSAAAPPVARRATTPGATKNSASACVEASSASPSANTECPRPPHCQAARTRPAGTTARGATGQPTAPPAAPADHAAASVERRRSTSAAATRSRPAEGPPRQHKDEGQHNAAPLATESNLAASTPSSGRLMTGASSQLCRGWAAARTAANQSLQSRACCAWSAHVSGVASLPANGSRVRLYRRVTTKRT